MESLEIEPMTLVLLVPCSTNYARGTSWKCSDEFIYTFAFHTKVWRHIIPTTTHADTFLSHYPSFFLASNGSAARGQTLNDTGVTWASQCHGNELSPLPVAPGGFERSVSECVCFEF